MFIQHFLPFFIVTFCLNLACQKVILIWLLFDSTLDVLIGQIWTTKTLRMYIATSLPQYVHIFLLFLLSRFGGKPYLLWQYLNFISFQISSTLSIHKRLWCIESQTIRTIQGTIILLQCFQECKRNSYCWVLSQSHQWVQVYF